MTHRERVIKRLGLENKPHSLAILAKASGIPIRILHEVEKRGAGAYRTNPTSVRHIGTFEKGGSVPMSQRLSIQQWSRARVYSFIDSALFKAPKKHDFDLHAQIS
jgi:hypothetical protein